MDDDGFDDFDLDWEAEAPAEKKPAEPEEFSIDKTDTRIGDRKLSYLEKANAAYRAGMLMKKQKINPEAWKPRFKRAMQLYELAKLPNRALDSAREAGIEHPRFDPDNATELYANAILYYIRYGMIDEALKTTREIEEKCRQAGLEDLANDFALVAEKYEGMIEKPDK